MTSLLADTHAVVWYLLDSPRLSQNAKAEMHGAIAAGMPVFVSVVTLVELTYLTERGRIDSSSRPPAKHIAAARFRVPGHRV